MALEGKIVDFGVTDILQLISQQQKTGVLIVERGKESIEILFWNGMIFSANPCAEFEKEYLGKKLVKSGLVSEQLLQQALEIQEKNFKHIGEILVDLGSVKKEVLNQIIHNQIYDTFSDLFQWKEGTYTFYPQSIDFNEKISSPLAIEHILLDVLRMIDEWPGIVRRISPMDTVFRKTDRRFPNEGEERTTSYEQRVVYDLVDGHNSVQDIVDKSLVGKFNTLKSLAELLDAGNIEVKPKEKPLTIEINKGKFIVKKCALIMGSYGVLILLMVVLIFLSPPHMKNTFSLFTDNFQSHPSAQSYLEKNRLLKIKNALHIYFLEKGKYPDDLKELTSTTILRGDDIKNSKGEIYYYRSKGDSYHLHQ